MKQVMGVVCLTLGVLGACGGESSSEASSLAARASVGDACDPGDDARSDFAGYSAEEINVEDQTSQCGDGVCLIHNFQGRPGCPYGQAAGSGDCVTAGGDPITVDVPPQLVARDPADTMQCSCRCDGPGDGPFCACPSGFECRKLIDDLGVGGSELAGSYCVKSGTYVADDTSQIDGAECDATAENCEGR